MNEALEKAEKLFALFCELYSDDSPLHLIGVSNNHVQIGGVAFRKVFAGQDWRLSRNGDFVEISAERNGIRYIALI